MNKLNQEDLIKLLNYLETYTFKPVHSMQNFLLDRIFFKIIVLKIDKEELKKKIINKRNIYSRTKHEIERVPLKTQYISLLQNLKNKKYKE